MLATAAFSDDTCSDPASTIPDSTCLIHQKMVSLVPAAAEGVHVTAAGAPDAAARPNCGSLVLVKARVKTASMQLGLACLVLGVLVAFVLAVDSFRRGRVANDTALDAGASTETRKEPETEELSPTLCEELEFPCEALGTGPAEPDPAATKHSPRCKHVSLFDADMHPAERLMRPPGGLGRAAKATGKPGANAPLFEPLCQELVVPNRFDCVLLVPKMDPRKIRDAGGQTVLLVEVNTSGTDSSASLLSPEGRLLATCSATTPSGAGSAADSAGALPEFALLRANGSLFANMRRTLSDDSQDLCVVSMMEGVAYEFKGAFNNHFVNVTDEAGTMQATTDGGVQDAGDIFRVRMAPFTDAGLVICGLLCIHHLGV